MTDDIAIKVDHVSKTFKLPHEKQASLKSSLINFHKRGYENQHVLRDVSFEVKKGEFFGIVGRNGSGKSTLLKILAGIYQPTNGSIHVNGRLVPFIELGVGFNPELTGRENVFLNGALLGFNRKEMLALYDQIVAFAELEKFMDQKLKNYSSGMQVRLAFSIAIRAQAGILILDEVLAVGDAAFQQKCYDYFNSLKKDQRTIVLVSHNMQIIDQFCDRALLLEQGEVAEIGASSKISTLYEDMFLEEERQRMELERGAQAGAKGQDPIEILGVTVQQAGKNTKRVKAKSPFSVAVEIRCNQAYSKVNVGVNIKNRDKVMILQTDSAVTIGQLPFEAGEIQTVIFEFENPLTNGLYYINLGVAEGDGIPQKVQIRREHIQEFTIEGVATHENALIHPTVTTKLTRSKK